MIWFETRHATKIIIFGEKLEIFFSNGSAITLEVMLSMQLNQVFEPLPRINCVATNSKISGQVKYSLPPSICLTQSKNLRHTSRDDTMEANWDERTKGLNDDGPKVLLGRLRGIMWPRGGRGREGWLSEVKLSYGPPCSSVGLLVGLS